MKKTMLISSVALLLALMFVFTTTMAKSEPSETKNTIVEIAASNEDFSTLVTAVKAAGLVETLNSSGKFTVFAPVNSAFKKLPEGTVSSLLKEENKDKLTSILTYHVVSGVYKSTDLKDGMELETVNGKKIKINIKNDMVMVNDAVVKSVDIEASNGVIHVIDAVILP